MKRTKIIGLLIVLLTIATLAIPVMAYRNKHQNPSSPLTTQEIYWLTYMREEEKLARDVYTKLFELYGLRVFENIMASEQNHMNAIKNMLDKYSLPDPAAGNGIGVFTNDYIQTLYETLFAKGKLSVIDALEVGVIIEETDIADLKDALAVTTHTDVDNVYANLLQGSYNHLSAFEYNLSRY